MVHSLDFCYYISSGFQRLGFSVDEDIDMLFTLKDRVVAKCCRHLYTAINMSGLLYPMRSGHLYCLLKVWKAEWNSWIYLQSNGHNAFRKF